MITEFLPLEDKIKLVDVFPPVIDQIDVFDTNHDIPGGIDGLVQLFQQALQCQDNHITEERTTVPNGLYLQF